MYCRRLLRTLHTVGWDIPKWLLALLVDLHGLLTNLFDTCGRPVHFPLHTLSVCRHHLYHWLMLFLFGGPVPNYAFSSISQCNKMVAYCCANSIGCFINHHHFKISSFHRYKDYSFLDLYFNKYFFLKKWLHHLKQLCILQLIKKKSKLVKILNITYFLFVNLLFL